jgi:hypothetical protein
MSDLITLFRAEENQARWKAESENASARWQLASIDKNCAYLISQAEPVNRLGINREHLRIILAYIRHGNLTRLNREIEETK